ncbi:hypothetical protein GCM10007028_07540 [Algibacter mikhailovii]|uniref:Uncharacterized protein n=1 Tax=Algibacter mikhailovii TaxID=425498 RepID=A0A918QYH0_9FLAO|nr:hypothetical protein GCM10007028_07540 [Algibacter mikhailovii]
MTFNLSFAQEAKNDMPTKEKVAYVELMGTIKEINKETREITVIGSEGELHTFTAGEDVKRFDEIAVGEVITFGFYKFLKAEFRKPTEEEIAEPLMVIADAEKAGMDMEPGVVIGAMVKAVVTIQVINLTYMYVTIKGPQGNYTTIDVEDEELIKKLHVGQVVIMTYGEAIAVSLTKVED